MDRGEGLEYWTGGERLLCVFGKALVKARQWERGCRPGGMEASPLYDHRWSDHLPHLPGFPSAAERIGPLSDGPFHPPI